MKIERDDIPVFGLLIASAFIVGAIIIWIVEHL